MQRFQARATALLTLGLVLTSTGAAHEDDPKILDAKPAVSGSGFQAGMPIGAQLPGGGMNRSSAGLFPADGVLLESWLTAADLGVPGQRGNDCWGYVSPSGREYALICMTGAMVVVEITDPRLPVVVGQIAGPDSFWRDVKVYQDWAYVVSEANLGVQVVDLSNVDSGQVTLENTITGNGTDATHNVAIDEDSGFLYRAGGQGNGIRIYSLANPGNPVFVGSWSDKYVHDLQVVTYSTGPFAGRELAYCCTSLGGSFLTVLDVTNKAAPTVLSELPYPGSAFSHQGWLSEDRTRFYLGDEADEGGTVTFTTTHVFDVADPSNASFVGAFNNDSISIGHNMYTRGGKLIQANYTSGLRIFDLDVSLNDPPEIAWFDTAPGSTSQSFNGLWSCYPYFPSGTIIGSDIELGLFVWSLGDPELEVSLTAAAPDLILSEGQTVEVIIDELLPGALDPSSPMLFFDTGLGMMSAPLTSNGGASYTAAFPSLPCGATLNWYVQAVSQSGQIETAPDRAPQISFNSVIGDAQVIVSEDDMETDTGWTGGLPGDTATTGLWTRGDPIGTGAQPEDDASAVGSSCWFTGQGSIGGSLGENDIDGGETTLLSPILDMSGLSNAFVTYSRWYSNGLGSAPGADVFLIDISNDGGLTWTFLEQVGPAGEGTNGGWIRQRFRVEDVIVPTAQMRLRFVASDLATGSIVEAAIDDVRVTDLVCGDGIGVVYCDANPNSSGRVGLISGSGSNSVASNDLSLAAMDLPPDVNGYFVVSTEQAFIPNAGGSQGNLCVGGNTGRYVDQIGNSGLTGVIPLTVDLTAVPQAQGPIGISPGATLNFQLWHRDLNPGVTSNFTRGYSVLFQ